MTTEQRPWFTEGDNGQLLLDTDRLSRLELAVAYIINGPIGVDDPAGTIAAYVRNGQDAPDSE